jgi:ribosomal protein L29
MKKTAKDKLREQTADELAKQIDGLRGDLLKARFATRLEGKRLSQQYRLTRRQIARIQTILTQKTKAAAQ